MPTGNSVQYSEICKLYSTRKRTIDFSLKIQQGQIDRLFLQGESIKYPHKLLHIFLLTAALSRRKFKQLFAVHILTNAPMLVYLFHISGYLNLIYFVSYRKIPVNLMTFLININSRDQASISGCVPLPSIIRPVLHSLNSHKTPNNSIKYSVVSEHLKATMAFRRHRASRVQFLSAAFINQSNHPRSIDCSQCD